MSFESTFAGLIVINTMTIAFETQYHSMDIEHGDPDPSGIRVGCPQQVNRVNDKHS